MCDGDWMPKMEDGETELLGVAKCGKVLKFIVDRQAMTCTNVFLGTTAKLQYMDCQVMDCPGWTSSKRIHDYFKSLEYRMQWQMEGDNGWQNLTDWENSRLMEAWERGDEREGMDHGWPYEFNLKDFTEESREIPRRVRLVALSSQWVPND